MYRAISGYTDSPRGHGMDRKTDMARAFGLGHISFPVHTMALGQSVYPDIALYISNYYILITQEVKMKASQYDFHRDELFTIY